MLHPAGGLRGSWHPHHDKENLMNRLFQAALAAALCFHLPACATDESTATPDPERPAAPAAASVCATAPAGVTTIERPMFPERADSPTFGYSFKVFPGTDPDAPTVIHLPGGPGQPSIAAERQPGFVPEEYTLILTDPRGVGCNAPASAEHYPDDFYQTIHSAGDVLAIVEHLQLDDYILYGISYGTVLATVTGSVAEAEGKQPPRALVLEGIVGRAFEDGEVEESYQLEWRDIRDRLPEGIRAQLMTEPLPLGLSAEEWGAGITTMLSLGMAQFEGTVAEVLLYNLAPEATEEQRAALREAVLGLGESLVDVFGQRLHDVIACHEITETNFRAFKLESGELVRTEAYCTSDPVDRPYFASDWLVTAPIYYFNGTNDPNTPIWQAQAHYEAQTMAERHFVAISGAGHNPMGLNLIDCKPDVWAAIAGGTGFDEAIAGCAWPTQRPSTDAQP
jgi:pimeloyl-ACP methyl ester carboxylesterase